MKRGLILVCSILALFASTAHSDSLLDKLKAAAEDKNQSEVGVSEPGAMVLTIDGIDKNMLGGGLMGLLAKGATTGRGDSYLMPPVSDKWGFADDIRYFAWTGDSAKTTEDVQRLKIQIASLSELAQRRGKPFVVFAHSWGSVLAYRAISELKAEGKLPGPSIRKLVTIGSPLGAKCSSTDVECVLARETTDKHVRLAGPSAVLGPVESWTNYWIEKDNISGPIEGLDQNIRLKYSFANPHQAYYSNSGLFRSITNTVEKDLEAFVAPSSATPEAAAASTAEPEPAPTSTGEYCLSSICLRQKPQELTISSADYELQRLHKNYQSDWLIGLSATQISQFQELAKQRNPPLQDVLALLGQVEVACGSPSIGLKPIRENLPAFSLGVIPSISGGWQGYQVVSISRLYQVPTEGRKDFEQQVEERFPMDNRAEQNGYRVFLRMEGKPRNTIPYSLKLRYSGPKVTIPGQPPGRVVPQAFHPQCERPKMPSLD